MRDVVFVGGERMAEHRREPVEIIARVGGALPHEERAPMDIQCAYFVISSQWVSVDHMTAIVGHSGDFTRAQGAVPEGRDARLAAKESSWEIREDADSVSEAVERLFRRLRPLRDNIRELCDLGCLTKFAIVQYFAPESDLGFAIDSEDVQLLADLGAFIDIDQYDES